MSNVGVLQSHTLGKDKVNETIVWLRKVLSIGAAKTLQFEFNPANIELLNKIRQLNEDQSRLMETIAQEKERTLEAIQTETERIEQLLSRFAVSEEKFSPRTREAFDRLVAAADLLGVRDYSESAFYTALLRFRDRKTRVTSELDEARALHDRLKQECCDLEERLGKVQAVKSKLDAEKSEAGAKLRKLRDERSSLKQKCIDYRTERRVLRTKLNELPFNLHHPVIVRDVEKLQELRDSVKQIEAEFARYENLSPNVDEAHKMIAESRALLDARTVN